MGYGLKPVKRADGQPYAGAVTHYLIDPAGEATNIFNGSIVTLGTDGYIALATGDGSDETTNNLGGSSIGAIGVFVGCSYTNDQGQTVHSQYYPSGALNGVAYVVDDPNVLFSAELDEAATQAMIGANAFLAAAQDTDAGDTATGNSNVELDGTVATTTEAFKIVGLDSNTSTDAVLVKFNPGYHMMTMNTGV
jgi:hypothetical protein